MVVSSVRPNALNPICRPELDHLDSPARDTTPFLGKSDDTSDHKTAKKAMATTQDLAWEILMTLRELGSYWFLMHSFSNGGCFVHEQLQRILLSCREESSSSPSSLQLAGLAHCRPSPSDWTEALQKFRLVGAVYDSCPALDLSRIDDALSYCTEDERRGLEWLHPQLRADLGQYLQARQSEYRDFMVEHDPLLPQLYVYSRTDPLVPFEPLKELVEERRVRAAQLQLQRRDSRSSTTMSNPAPATAGIISELILDDSPHCAHYLYHRDLYESALDFFLEEATAATTAATTVDDTAALAAPRDGDCRDPSSRSML
jgi:hypothetical protein